MATYNGHQEDASGNILLSIGNGMTATLETGSTASQAYTKGSYLFFNNRMCKATSAITAGDTLEVGTNLGLTTIGDELTSHLRADNGDEFYFDYKDGVAGFYPNVSKTASQFVPFGVDSPYVEGTFTSSTSTTVKVTLGYKPAWLYVYVYPNATTVAANFYDSRVNTAKYFRSNCSSGGSYSGFQNVTGGTYHNSIASIDNDGFTMNKVDSAFSGTWSYIAVESFT